MMTDSAKICDRLDRLTTDYGQPFFRGNVRVSHSKEFVHGTVCVGNIKWFPAMYPGPFRDPINRDTRECSAKTAKLAIKISCTTVMPCIFTITCPSYRILHINM